MAVVTVFAASFCNGEAICRRAAEELGLDFVSDDEILKTGSDSFSVDPKKLARAMQNRESILGRFRGDRERLVACVRLALTERLLSDRVIYLGYGGHLIPYGIPHVLKTCLVADRAHRTQQALDEGLSRRQATKAIKCDDESRAQWTHYLFDRSPWDRELYDAKIPVHTSSIDEVVANLCDLATRPEIEKTIVSENALRDYLTGSRAALALADGGFNNVEVICESGVLTVLSPRTVFGMDRRLAKIERIVRGVAGVEVVNVQTEDTVEPDGESEEQPRILLVDDERDFIQTLSDRLRMRQFASSVAFDGNSALAAIEAEEPEVMVLDLRMPGIDGLEVLRKIKTQRPEIEVIILTGEGKEEDRHEAFELGAFAYLKKPVKIELLTKTMTDAYQKIVRRRLALHTEEVAQGAKK